MRYHEETGDAFAIPDLWEKSGLANFEQDGNGRLVETEASPFAPSMFVEYNQGRVNGRPVGTLAAPTPVTPSDYFSPTFTLPSSNDLDLHLPDLTFSGYGPLEDVENLDLSSVSSTTGSSSPAAYQEQEEEDVWSSAQILDPEPIPAELKSWEKFYDQGSKQSRTAYISEGGPHAFDAALDSHFTRSKSDLHQESAGHILHCGPVLKVVFPASPRRLKSSLTPNRVCCILA